MPHGLPNSSKATAFRGNGIAYSPFAKALRGSFVTGMNRNVLELVDVERRDSVAQIYLDRYVREKSVEIREQLCEDNLL